MEIAQLAGIVPPLITPLTSDEELDLPGLTRLIDHVLDGGVHGLFVLGTTGEGPALSHRLRHQLVERVCEHVEGRVPVLVGITDCSMRESLELASRAYDAGAAALVAAAPYYLPTDQQELEVYFQQLADSVSLPLFLYNMPSCTKIGLHVDVVQRLSHHSNIIGIKDSSGDMQYFAELCRQLADRRPEFRVLIGPEELLVEAMTRGADGGVSGGANMFPHLYVQCYQAAAEGRPEDASRLQQLIRNVAEAVYALSPHPSRFIVGIKTALAEFGLCSGEVLQPSLPMAADKRQQLRANLSALANSTNGRDEITFAHPIPQYRS